MIDAEQNYRLACLRFRVQSCRLLLQIGGADRTVCLEPLLSFARTSCAIAIAADDTNSFRAAVRGELEDALAELAALGEAE